MVGKTHNGHGSIKLSNQCLIRPVTIHDQRRKTNIITTTQPEAQSQAKAFSTPARYHTRIYNNTNLIHTEAQQSGQRAGSPFTPFFQRIKTKTKTPALAHGRLTFTQTKTRHGLVITGSRRFQFAFWTRQRYQARLQIRISMHVRRVVNNSFC